MKHMIIDWLLTAVEVTLLSAIAFGTIWTAYESHIANIGVLAWQHEFSQIHQSDGPTDNHIVPTPEATPTPISF